ncbi:MAG: hypothetical protein EOP87_00930 [Verrucomicrobiaceae bacterium]|nr:MAG: hypothetical protein EOP87_00930 [Verrucomicrobiaceae bacterium]
MSAPLLLERLIGCFAYFIPGGTLVDALTVSATVKPDIVPLDNWTAYNLGSILTYRHVPEIEDNSFKKASPSGGWEKAIRKKVVSDALLLKTREMGEPQLRLEFGLLSAIVEGTAQSPFANTARQIDGWLKVHYRQEDGTDMSLMDMWCTMELVNGLTAEGKTAEPELSFTHIKSVGGVAVAGNTIVFPVAA